MTKDEMQQIRDALFNGTIAAVNTDEDVAMYQNALAILDAELAKPEQEPVGCKHNRYSVDVHEQTGTCYDCGAEGRMRFVVDGTAPPDHYDQTALELCEVCGWKTLIPGDCCLNCEREKVEQEPVAWMGYSGVGEKIVSPKAIYSWMTIPLYTAPVPTPQRECETCARKRERLLKAGFLKSPLRAKNEEKNT